MTDRMWIPHYQCMANALPAGTVTFLFTDIEGSTKLLHEQGPEAYARSLTDHRAVIREAIALHGGVEVDTQGDAFFIAFSDAAAALTAAHEAQRRLAAGPIRVRMGLHSGEPTLTLEGYVGVDVHTGARIAAAAHGAQVILSLRTKELAGPGFSLSDLGEHRLKDLERPVWIYQLGDGRFPPLKTLSNTNLPALPSSFVGRDRELGGALERLERTRLLTIVGPGGAGKTRFAVELASRCLARFPNGVFWVPLAAVRDPSLVEQTIGDVLGAAEGLASHIGHKHLLLVLDNFEQVIDAAPALSPLLSECPNLTLLVTSRETLRIDGESEFPLPPLAEDEGVALFCSRAGTSPSDAVAPLVERLDGLPLAIELAAARSKLFTVPQLIERLSSRLDDFKGGRGADPRQRTLRATIQWSFDLLKGDEQTAFMRSSLFAGGFTLEAAERVTNADPDVLQSLLEKSMVRRVEDRFEMLETIREFALERFLEAPEAETTRRRHAEYYTGLAEEADIAEGVEIARQPLDQEWGNLRAALEWACGGGDPAIGLRLSGALWRFWWDRGAAKEGSAWYEAALAAGADEPEELRARAIYGAANMAMVRQDPETAIGLLEQSLETFRRTGEDIRVMRALNDLGIAWQGKGDMAVARRFHEESLAIADALGLERASGTVRLNLSELAQYEGRLADAGVILDELVVWARLRGYDGILATALGNRARIAIVRGDYPRAGSDIRDSMALTSMLIEGRQHAHSLALAAAVLAERSDRRLAIRALALCDSMCEESGFVLEVNERALYDQTLERLRDETEGTDFDAQWAEGHRADPDAASGQIIDALK